MEKKVLAGASREKQKYFFEPAFNEIPQAVKDEIRNICILMWYVINMTDEGVKIREELLREKNN